jgi:hypothetical protein
MTFERPQECANALARATPDGPGDDDDDDDEVPIGDPPDDDDGDLDDDEDDDEDDDDEEPLQAHRAPVQRGARTRNMSIFVRCHLTSGL